MASKTENQFLRMLAVIAAGGVKEIRADEGGHAEQLVLAHGSKQKIVHLLSEGKLIAALWAGSTTTHYFVVDRRRAANFTLLDVMVTKPWFGEPDWTVAVRIERNGRKSWRRWVAEHGRDMVVYGAKNGILRQAA